MSMSWGYSLSLPLPLSLSLSISLPFSGFILLPHEVIKLKLFPLAFFSVCKTPFYGFVFNFVIFAGHATNENSNEMVE